MDCFFNNIDKRNCRYFLRCEGIYRICKKLGTTQKFAQDYSKYILRVSILHKLRDKNRDIRIKGIFSRVKGFFIKILYSLYRKSFQDTFNLEKRLSKIEQKIEFLEKRSNIADPMEYFELSGEAYGLIYKYAALHAQVDEDELQKYWILGKLIGTMVSLRDSVKDLRKDLEKDNFNPFRGWELKEIEIFFNENVNQIKDEIKQLTNKQDIIYNISLDHANQRNSRIAPIIKSSISASFLTFPLYPSSTDGTTCGCVGDMQNACAQWMAENICCVCGIIAIVIIVVVICVAATGADCGGCDGCDCDCDC